LSPIDRVKEQQRNINSRYGKSNDLRGAIQVLTTLLALTFLWSIVLVSADVSLIAAAAAMLLIILFTLRVFALMHECGHGSLFRSQWLNRASGFTLGVLSGMPQYVWSQHHNYHHAHNGNWEKYRGPYTTRSVEEYAAMSTANQRMYRAKCSMAAAPLVGFIYLVFNPRFTWAKGSLGFVVHVIRAKWNRPGLSMREHAAAYKTRYWASNREYWHMFWNNVVLLTLWVLMSRAFGAGHFFAIYLSSLSIAGGAGIILFTVQHNFEHAYASSSKAWDYTTGAINGTSFLVLPGWLNWFTVDMGYHHIHHLSARIPNYRLAQCHQEFEHLFADVTRIRLASFHDALKCILWDARAQRIISVLEYHRQT
jgi:acyl-lipid omega-6 desaturase (Delta-12 desaturase)